MPTYAYACTVCGHAFEIQQSFSDDSLTVCPECDGRLRKVFSSVGVVFKGSGFYRNDARAGRASPPRPRRAVARPLGVDVHPGSRARCVRPPAVDAAPRRRPPRRASRPRTS